MDENNGPQLLQPRSPVERGPSVLESQYCGPSVQARRRRQFRRQSSNTRTFATFVDIRKAFGTSWIEATLIRLCGVGVTGGMWRTIANFLSGTLSQVRDHGGVSASWVDTGVAEGGVLSPLLFNLLIKNLAAAIRRAAPGVRLVTNSNFRCSCQLYADDLVILAESEGDLQPALDAVSRWGLQWRFSFGIGLEKSAAMVFGPNRQRPACSVTLSGSVLPVVQSYRHLDVLFTHSLHAEHLVSRDHRLFAQRASWVRAEGHPVSQPPPPCHICPSWRHFWHGVLGQLLSQCGAV